jgi:hypothetical protein
VIADGERLDRLEDPFRLHRCHTIIELQPAQRSVCWSSNFV